MQESLKAFVPGPEAGSVETATMTHLRPDLVHMNRARNFRPHTCDIERDIETLRAIDPVPFGRKSLDMQDGGVCGDALDADAERGGKVVDFMANKLVTLIAEVSRYPIAAVKPPDWRTAKH